MAKTQFTMTTTVIKDDNYYREGYTVILTGGGFRGKGSSGTLSYAFTLAYDELMAKVAEGTFV